VPVFAWFVAQLMKVTIVLIQNRRMDFTRFVGSGGMPSSHSSFIVTLAVVIGKQYGWNSGLFAVSLAIALIVMYDAAGVRRAAGKQAKVLNKMIHSFNDMIEFEGRLKELIGHSPVEVVAGALLGIMLGLLLG
jgi:hypothetical protein